MRPSCWFVYQASARGANHCALDCANQDAAAVSGPRQSRALILAIADGHGNARSFRSARGSQMAVELAQVVWRGAVRRLGSSTSLHRVRAYAEKLWPRALVWAWRAAVRRDIAKNPFSTLEFAAFPEAPPRVRRGEELPFHAYLAYGTTLLTVVITSRWIVYSQLGDGDIVRLNGAGEASRPWRSRYDYKGKETISLCSRGAELDFQIRVEPRPHPALLFLASDGYGNCFGNDETFFQVAQEYLAQMRVHGPEAVRAETEGWLVESSREGSRDDISIALAVRRTALSRGGSRAQSSTSTLELPADEKVTNDQTT